MVREIAIFRTHESQAEVFVETYRGVANILTDAEGRRDADLHRGFEDPDSFTLIVEWGSVEAHTALTQKPEFGDFGGGDQAPPRRSARGAPRGSRGVREV